MRLGQSLICSAEETWSQRVSKSKLGLATFDRHEQCARNSSLGDLRRSLGGLRRQHQILLVVGVLRCLSTEENFPLAKIVAYALNHCMKIHMNSCQNQRFAASDFCSSDLQQIHHLQFCKF